MEIQEFMKLVTGWDSITPFKGDVVHGMMELLIHPLSPSQTMDVPLEWIPALEGEQI